MYLAVEAINRGLDVIVVINNTTKNIDESVVKNIKKHLGTDAIIIKATKKESKQKIMQCIEVHRKNTKKLHWESDAEVLKFKNNFLQKNKKILHRKSRVSLSCGGAFIYFFSSASRASTKASAFCKMRRSLSKEIVPAASLTSTQTYAEIS